MPTAVFTGGLYGDDLPRGYASLDVFVHTGQFETFCQAVQEAQASGVPTIAPAAGGPIDLIDQGHNGYLLEVETFTRDLPIAVDRIIGDRLPAFREHALAGIQDKTWYSLCTQLVSYYGDAIHRHGRPAGVVSRNQQLGDISHRTRVA